MPFTNASDAGEPSLKNKDPGSQSFRGAVRQLRVQMEKEYIEREMTRNSRAQLPNG